MCDHQQTRRAYCTYKHTNTQTKHLIFSRLHSYSSVASLSGLIVLVLVWLLGPAQCYSFAVHSHTSLKISFSLSILVPSPLLSSPLPPSPLLAPRHTIPGL